MIPVKTPPDELADEIIENLEKAIGDMSKEIVELSAKLLSMEGIISGQDQEIVELNEKVEKLQDQAFKYMQMVQTFEHWMDLHR